MANLGVQILTNSHLDARARVLLEQFNNIDCVNTTRNKLQVPFPGNLSSARLRRITTWVDDVATLHNLVGDFERCAVAQLRGGDNLSGLSPSSSVQQFGEGASLDGWICEWLEPFHMRMYPGDEIQFYLSPADDNGSPTGDYNIGLLYDTLEF